MRPVLGARNNREAARAGTVDLGPGVEQQEPPSLSRKPIGPEADVDSEPLLQLCLKTFSFSFTVSSSSSSVSFFLLPASTSFFFPASTSYLSCSSFFLLFILLSLPLSPTLSFSCSSFLFLLLLLSSFPLPPIYSSSSPSPSISDIKLRALHIKANTLVPLPRGLQKYFQGCLWPILLLPGDKAQGGVGGGGRGEDLFL